jgi:hypothetical protein
MKCELLIVVKLSGDHNRPASRVKSEVVVSVFRKDPAVHRGELFSMLRSAASEVVQKRVHKQRAVPSSLPVIRGDMEAR